MSLVQEPPKVVKTDAGFCKPTLKMAGTHGAVPGRLIEGLSLSKTDWKGAGGKLSMTSAQMNGKSPGRGNAAIEGCNNINITI